MLVLSVTLFANLMWPLTLSVLVPVGFYWTVKNIPTITHGATDLVLEDKSFYKTLIRLGPTYNKYGPAFAKIFLHFGWKKASIIANDQRTCDYGATSINEFFPKYNLTITEWIRVPSRGFTDQELEKYLDRIQERSRSEFHST